MEIPYSDDFDNGKCGFCYEKPYCHSCKEYNKYSPIAEKIITAAKENNMSISDAIALIEHCSTETVFRGEK